jgi:hypothetical protein
LADHLAARDSQHGGEVTVESPAFVVTPVLRSDLGGVRLLWRDVRRVPPGLVKIILSDMQHEATKGTKTHEGASGRPCPWLTLSCPCRLSVIWQPVVALHP